MRTVWNNKPLLLAMAVVGYCVVMAATAAKAESQRLSKHGAWTVFSDFKDTEAYPSCSMMHQRPAIMMGQFVFFDFDQVFMNISRPNFNYTDGTPVRGRLNFRDGSSLTISGFGGGLNANFTLTPEVFFAVQQAAKNTISFSVSIGDQVTEVSADGWISAYHAVQDCLARGFVQQSRGGVLDGSIVIGVPTEADGLPYQIWAYRDGSSSEPLGCSLTWKGDGGAIYELFYPDIAGAPSKLLARLGAWRFTDQEAVPVTYVLDGIDHLAQAETRRNAIVIKLSEQSGQKVQDALINNKPIGLRQGLTDLAFTPTGGRGAAGAVFACQVQIGGE